MIPIVRGTLSSSTQRTLRGRQQRVDAAADPAATATKSWKTFSSGNARQEVMHVLQTMCSNRVRCMYCEDNEGTDIDHFRPKAHYPEWSFTWENYLLACSRCNSNYKRDRFPVDGDRELLLDPTAANPFDHLILSLSTGVYIGSDDIGLASIEVYGLNRDVCVKGRFYTWVSLCALIRDYERSNQIEREAILTTVNDFPFQGVRHWLARVLAEGDHAATVPPDVHAIADKHPELLTAPQRHSDQDQP
ncbi:HNH endonuclease [Nocardia tengchongensis]|uniref:HNH endonuclease n=1 Tax=Nocardia tengchongensis TaxID=2055889 RepID=A0ABX8CQU9_9NOCA|nr:HNH endonuclease [Nocardia tengchongensis]QVI20910.1 HNH endonuclease [Nocardia tengchongensis]